jgi:hypothetical protein
MLSASDDMPLLISAGHFSQGFVEKSSAFL